jgi:GTP cyclohydrolase I
MDNDDDRNIMYQIQILQAFGMHNFDQDKINKKVLHLYQKLINCNEVKEILEEGIKVNSEMQLTHEIMFMCLFSYHFFDLFHKCLIDYFTTGSILEESKCNMIHAIISQ